MLTTVNTATFSELKHCFNDSTTQLEPHSHTADAAPKLLACSLKTLCASGESTVFQVPRSRVQRQAAATRCGRSLTFETTRQTSMRDRGRCLFSPAGGVAESESGLSYLRINAGISANMIDILTFDI